VPKQILQQLRDVKATKSHTGATFLHKNKQKVNKIPHRNIVCIAFLSD